MILKCLKTFNVAKKGNLRLAAAYGPLIKCNRRDVKIIRSADLCIIFLVEITDNLSEINH